MKSKKEGLSIDIGLPLYLKEGCNTCNSRLSGQIAA